MNIGAKIKAFRKEKRVTQEELADYLHISSQAVSKWETGASSPDIDMLPKLAIYFGTSLDNLLDFDQSRIDAQAHAMFDFFKRWPIYQRITEIMEAYWNNGNLMDIYQ